jgi:hypothetical protein
MIAVSTGLVRERTPTPLMRGGMSASPHQVAVFTPRARLAQQPGAPKPEKAGILRTKFVRPSGMTEPRVRAPAAGPPGRGSVLRVVTMAGSGLPCASLDQERGSGAPGGD